MRLAIVSFVVAVSLFGCGQPAQEPSQTTTEVITPEQIEAETARLNAWFEEKFEYELLQSPIYLTLLGRTERQDEIDDFTDASQDAALARSRANLAELKANFDYDKLTADAKISYDLWVYSAKETEVADAFRHHGYVFEQMQAIHSFFPQLLITYHQVRNEQDLKNYIARVSAVAVALDQLIASSKKSAEIGVRPPYFAFEAVISESQGIISGAPFDDSEDSAVWADAKAKVASLVESEILAQEAADAYLTQIEAAYLNDFKPAYERLIEWQKADQVNASDVAKGIGALPNGKAYYEERLANQTTTSMSADEVHQLGLSEVARLRAEMEQVQAEFGFEGSLQAFFTFLRETKDDERLYYPNTDEGRQGYIDDTTTAINRIKAELPNYFGILPKADLEVRRVEAFREQDGAAQHYSAPALDGSRPGIYYAHLSDMTAMPKRELEVIAYHEGLPGHHMQIAIAQELEAVPTFRTQQFYTAYVEGWALYTEWLAKEIPGTFADPLSEFGRLGSEMWRAIRLVVDTGLHAKNWSEQQAIEYFKANSAITDEQARSEVRRYMVLPAQATSYKVGMIEIQRMRADAETALGEQFDIRGFHDTVLGGGAMPLSLLERRVNDWIESVKSQ